MRSGPLPGPGARGEDDRVGVADGLDDVVDRRGLEVEDQAPGADRLQVGDVPGVAHEPHGLVAAPGEQALQAAGDAPVAPGDDDPHEASLPNFSRRRR